MDARYVALCSLRATATRDEWRTYIHYRRSSSKGRDSLFANRISMDKQIFSLPLLSFSFARSLSLPLSRRVQSIGISIRLVSESGTREDLSSDGRYPCAIAIARENCQIWKLISIRIKRFMFLVRLTFILQQFLWIGTIWIRKDNWFDALNIFAFETRIYLTCDPQLIN